MKVLKTNNFISERMKIKPVTNAEWEQMKEKSVLIPFGLTKRDLVGEMSNIPMGIAVRMLEEQELQNNTADITIFCYNCAADKKGRGFDWQSTEQGKDFWRNVLDYHDFDNFFDKYPEYKKYNLD